MLKAQGFSLLQPLSTAVVDMTGVVSVTVGQVRLRLIKS